MADIEKETRQDFGLPPIPGGPVEEKPAMAGGRSPIPPGVMNTVREQNDALGDAGTPQPHKLTPEEMAQNPLLLLNPDQEEEILREQQKNLDDTWAVAEGGGDHDWSINDNDSKNGPVPLQPGRTSGQNPPKDPGPKDLPQLPPLQKK